MTVDTLLSRLDKVRQRGRGQWLACCPAHEDKSPSLAIKSLSDGRILINCFAGCDSLSILQAIDLTMNDLFPDGGLGEFRGWEQLKKSREPSLEDTILQLAKDTRANKVRLSRKDLERELQAYLRTRNANANG